MKIAGGANSARPPRPMRGASGRTYGGSHGRSCHRRSAAAGGASILNGFMLLLAVHVGVGEFVKRQGL